MSESARLCRAASFRRQLESTVYRVLDALKHYLSIDPFSRARGKSSGRKRGTGHRVRKGKGLWGVACTLAVIGTQEDPKNEVIIISTHLVSGVLSAPLPFLAQGPKNEVILYQPT